MAIQVVRRMTSTVTHVADVKASTAALSFGKAYARPAPDTVALCGVHIKDGVVMQPGTTVRCPACRHLNK